MAVQPSLRRRRLSNQSARLAQPFAWPANAGVQPLNFNNNGSSMTASATANTPGAWVQYIASNAIASTDTICAIHILGTGNNQTAGTDNSMLLDIGTGAAGSEVIVAQNIAIGGLANSSGFGPLFTVPVRIAGATRVACRVRAATGSRVLTMTQIWASTTAATAPFADRLPTSVDVLGTSDSTSSGTAMSGSSGSWTQIAASTSKDYQALVLVPSGPGSAVTAGGIFRLDLGIGASGSEQAVAYYYVLMNGNSWVGMFSLSLATNTYGGFVPAGTRIAVRHNAASSPERLTACVIGVPYA